MHNHVLKSHSSELIHFLRLRLNQAQTVTFWIQHHARMWIKCEQNGFPANGFRFSIELLNDLLMTNMNAIKRANCEHRIRDVQDLIKSLINFHSFSLSSKVSKLNAIESPCRNNFFDNTPFISLHLYHKLGIFASVNLLYLN
jgi:hypothetical protein